MTTTILPELPRLVGVEGDEAVFRDAMGQERACRAGDTLAGWRVEALFRRHGKPVAVLEHTAVAESFLVYVEPAGGRARLSWPIGDLAALAEDPEPVAHPEEYYRELRSAGSDLLLERVLSDAGDPDLVRLQEALPPLVSYTFVGDRRIAEKPVVEPNGSVRGFFDAGREYDPEDTAAVWRHALLSSHLPAIAYAFYDREARAGREEIAFGRPRSRGGLAVWVRLRDETGARSYLRCRRAPEPTAPADFYAALLDLHEENRALLAPAAHVDLPDPSLADGHHAALLRGFLTFVGQHPKYGIGVYAQPEHDTFPPAVLYQAAAALEWGLFDEAKAFLGHYLASFVRADGSFVYYGPAVSEYGQMLALVSRCRQLTGDSVWFSEYRSAARRIAERLVGLRIKSKTAYPPGSPVHGLIPGIPEADYTGMGLPVEAHYSGDAWACRGLAEFAGALAAAGDHEGAARYREEADAYRADIRRSLERSICRNQDPPFVPAIAGRHEPYRALTENTAASYANYRFYPELLSAGLLRPEEADAVLRCRWARGGDLLAMTRFSAQLDAWPVAHYAWGLLEAGHVDRYRTLLYAHLLHHQSRGTYTAYEQVAFDPKGCRVRRHVADYCVCAQLIVPLMLKWMLAWEPWDGECLWLNRATPCAWHAPGMRFGAEGLPTRWGRVSVNVAGREGGVRAELALPEGVPEVRLCLYAPDGSPFRALRVEGGARHAWDGATRTVTLFRPPSRIVIEASW